MNKLEQISRVELALESLDETESKVKELPTCSLSYTSMVLITKTRKYLDLYYENLLKEVK